ncbi:non-ribosomal peptide synthetase [Streptomyces sp. NPDC001594]|uniref:non-ribosomal peptide synthetase n=1 Tax=Streptomyces sp. NPDC001594 TaxID=3364590 RepID=UPI0036B35DA4
MITTPHPSAQAPAATFGAGLVHGGFSEQARRTPDALALTADGTSVTYRDLDKWSDRLCAGLRASGVEPGSRVGILLDRSTELIAVLLATLKAGAVYVPMDPATPADRLRFIASDAALVLTVVEQRDASRDAGSPRATVAALLAAAPDGPRSAAAPSPGEPAYVIYTSGSTGKPKGVVVPHGNVIALLDGTADEYAFGPDDVWTWFHSAAFDFSVWEMWACLLTGGRLVIVPESARRNPDEFRQLLVDESVTVLNQTPSSFAQVLDVECRRPARLALRLVVFGGEPLDTRSLLPWFDLHPETECRMVNMFGITETTVHVTAQTITRELARAGSRSVGRPIPGWSVRVVDEQQRPLPPGESGEIVVGGAGVASYYLNRPELTAERFVADPDTGERLYRSGDLGRLAADGTLEHLGRIDSQVKLRGYRIELGEIRSVLLDDARVLAAAVVLTNASDAATARLDAYVVPAPGTDPAETGSILAAAAGTLPSYMVPSTLTLLDALPLTANGKLDPSALPPATVGTASPAGEGTGQGGDASEEPAGLEGVVLAVWREVLAARVGPDDHFFDIGGNSLLAARVTRALRDAGVDRMSVRDLYVHPTPRRLAGHLAAQGSAPVPDHTSHRTEGR